jgi:glutaredoxin
MLLILGLKNCSKCDITKQILTSKGLSFEYHILNDLPEEDRRKYAKLARDCNYNTMPLIVQDEKLIKLEDLT